MYIIIFLFLVLFGSVAVVVIVDVFIFIQFVWHIHKNTQTSVMNRNRKHICCCCKFDIFRLHISLRMHSFLIPNFCSCCVFFLWISTALGSFVKSLALCVCFRCCCSSWLPSRPTLKRPLFHASFYQMDLFMLLLLLLFFFPLNENEIVQFFLHICCRTIQMLQTAKCSNV